MKNFQLPCLSAGVTYLCIPIDQAAFAGEHYSAVAICCGKAPSIIFIIMFFVRRLQQCANHPPPRETKVPISRRANLLLPVPPPAVRDRILVLVTTNNKPSERMGSFSILSLLLLFCLIPSCLILLWSSSQTAGTWWEATVSAVYSQKPDGVSTGGSPPGNNGSPSLPHGHGEEANHHLPSWLFSASTAACPAAGAAGAMREARVDRVRADGAETLEAKRNALPGPRAPVLGDDDEEGVPANVAEPEAPVPPPPPQGTENVPNAAGDAAGTGTEVEPSPIVAATVSGSSLLLSLRPPPPLPARSISAPARLVSRPVVFTTENTISGDVSPAALASATSRVRASTIEYL
ncbi:unnamed protein product [Ectocarpus sp. 12 AP-2014]